MLAFPLHDRPACLQTACDDLPNDGARGNLNLEMRGRLLHQGRAAALRGVRRREDLGLNHCWCSFVRGRKNAIKAVYSLPDG